MATPGETPQAEWMAAATTPLVASKPETIVEPVVARASTADQELVQTVSARLDELATHLSAVQHQLASAAEREATWVQGLAAANAQLTVLAEQLGQVVRSDATEASLLAAWAAHENTLLQRLDPSSWATPIAAELTRATGVDRLADEVANNRLDIQQQLEAVASLASRAEMAEEERVAQMQSLAERNAELGAVRARLEALEAQLQRELARSHDDSRRLQELEQLLAERESRLDEREGALERARRERDEQLAVLRRGESELEAQRQQVVSLKRRLAEVERERDELHGLRADKQHLDGQVLRLTADLHVARQQVADHSSRLAGYEQSVIVRVTRRLRGASAVLSVIAVLLVAAVLLVWYPPARDLVQAVVVELTASSWRMVASVAVVGMLVLGVLYQVREHLPAWLAPRWRWLAVSRSRWLGALKLLLLYLVHAGLVLYVKLWERLRGKRSDAV
jgi:hypothetical protein